MCLFKKTRQRIKETWGDVRSALQAWAFPDSGYFCTIKDDEDILPFIPKHSMVLHKMVDKKAKPHYGDSVIIDDGYGFYVCKTYTPTDKLNSILYKRKVLGVYDQHDTLDKVKERWQQRYPDNEFPLEIHLKNKDER